MFYFVRLLVAFFKLPRLTPENMSFWEEKKKKKKKNYKTVKSFFVIGQIEYMYSCLFINENKQKN